jgi:hypothetical protein
VILIRPDSRLKPGGIVGHYAYASLCILLECLQKMKLIPATNSTGGKTMQTFKHILLTVILITLVSSAAAKPGGGKGGGKPADGDDGTIPVSVTFLDAQTDLIGSDDGTPYLDGTDGVQAFLGCSGSPNHHVGYIWISPTAMAQVQIVFPHSIPS